MLLLAVPNQSGAEEIPVTLNEILSDYSSSILQRETVQLEGGAENKHTAIRIHFLPVERSSAKPAIPAVAFEITNILNGHTTSCL